MADTKIATKINKSESYEKKIKESKENLLSRAQEGVKSFEDLYYDIEKCWEENEALHFKDDSIILYPELNLVMKNCKAEKISIFGGDLGKIFGKTTIMNGQKVEPLTDVEAYTIFFKYSGKNRPDNYTQILCIQDEKYGYIKRDRSFIALNTIDQGTEVGSISNILIDAYKRKASGQTNVANVRVPLGYHFFGSMTKLQILLEIGQVPEEVESKALFRNLVGLIKAGYVEERKGKLCLTKSGKEAVLKQECSKIGNVPMKEAAKNRVDLLSQIDLNKLSPEDKKVFLSYYAECDKLRANTSPYDLKWLEDANQGHWELWDGNESDKTVQLEPGNKIYARNPACDIRGDSIVGIDFGTKSTVVVCQDESGKIKPMLVGTGNYKGAIDARDFENPTVMQFIDRKSFLNAYKSKAGRPFTKWKDLMVSHAANESMKDTGIRSDEFYSFLYDLKQWAGEGTEEVYVKDKKGMEVRLPKYEDIINDDDADMNPIEIYAYYIGLYINNMNNGIYMNYLLSFPVTYEKRIREAILKSFERGLKKSLPESILKDSDVMSEFSVVAGTSEPAAYAICALEQYGFDLSETGKAFYGIFDFGGGTSDFDFGLWTTPEDEEIYDYCIEHFGSEGDRYLGGENLLQLIAFEVFKQNIEVCSKESIVFSKPIEKNDIPSELMGYVNSSQEARLNLKLMMEKMRPFWERSDDAGNIVVDINDFSEFQISLFDSNGVLKPNLFFQVNIETLDSIVRDRIKKGVRQFFNSLMGVFRDKYIDKTACIDTVNIFLAGNSSKSPMLNDIFNDAIQEYNARIAELNGDGDAQIQYFRLFPPLGTAAAKVIQKENGIDVADDIEKPTGKTGVAWGLIEGRAGGRIEVKEEIAFENESKFAYNLGIISKNKFKLKLERDISYDKWHRFFPAKQKIIEVAYTSLPEAIGGNLPASDENVRRKRVNVSKFGDGLYLYIKPISRDKVECAVGNSEGRVEKKTIFEISFN